MRKHIVVFLPFLLFIALSASAPVAASVHVSGQVDLFSSYIWRGFDLNPTHQPVMQPSVTFAFGDSGLSANVWFSISSVDRQLDETDFTLSYDFKISENVALSAGFIHYAWYLTKNFDFDDNTTHEFYLTAALPKVPLSPGLSVYYDFHNGDGIYAALSLAHSLKLKKNAAVDLSASLGYNDGIWLEEDDDTGISDLSLGAAVPIVVGKVTLTPFVNYTIVFLDDVSEENHFWFGLSVTF